MLPASSVSLSPLWIICPLFSPALEKWVYESKIIEIGKKNVVSFCSFYSSIVSYTPTCLIDN
jgi:hypothetical protein